MFLELYHPASRQVFRGKRGHASEYGHAFGGASDYAGLAAFSGEPAFHLLLRLNTADPAVGLTIPGVHWLPLLCAIRYGACRLGYRVISDREVKILHQGETKAWDGFPYDGYPERLPASPLMLEERAYDPSNHKDACFYAGVFGYDALSPEQFADLARFVVEEGIFDPDISDWETPESYLREGNPLPFTQGSPVDDCPAPECRNHGRASSLRTFAIFQEGRPEARDLWGPNCGSLQIVYQICPACSAIRTTNQSD
jgi:hypothetical protein